jgi:adenine/guanine/hypoxanthine permease
MSILWAGAVVEMIERRFRRAAAWLLVAAAASALGFMHATTITPFDVIGAVQTAWKWAGAYVAMAAVLIGMPWIAKPTEEPMV